MMERKVLDAIYFVYSYAPEIREWKVLKKELLKALSSDKRKLFSTRDPRTKKQNLNEFEKDVVSRWEEIAGVEVYLSQP